jgi:hypothetical protein
MAAITHFHRKLQVKITERETMMKDHLAGGGAASFDLYQRQVGHIEALRVVLQMCDEIERELDE